MTDITPEGRKALRELCEKTKIELTTRPKVHGRDWQRTEMVPCSPGLSHQLAEAVPALLDALDRAEAEIAQMKADGIDHVNQVEDRCIEIAAENASLRERVEALEEVREKLDALCEQEKNVSWSMFKHRCGALEVFNDRARELAQAWAALSASGKGE